MYSYTAVDPGGVASKGHMEADSPRTARQRLREQGLLPVTVESLDQSHAKARQRTRIYAPGNRQLAMMTRQIAALSRSGLPLLDILNLLIQQSVNAREKRLLVYLRERLAEGLSLSDAMQQAGRAFPALYQASIAAGESSGKLAAVFEQLADYLEDKSAIHQKVMLSLLYPLILTLISIAVVTSLLVFVVPEVVLVFSQTGQALPALTQALIAISDFLQHNGLLLLFALGLLALLVSAMLKHAPFRARWHLWLLKLPLLGRVIQVMNTARFTRTLAILSQSRVDILRSLDIAARVVENLPMREAVNAAAGRVREGTSLSRALQVSGLFPVLTLQMISSGENSGQLGDMLDSTASYHERELETLSRSIVGLFEPLMIVVMGGIILMIVMAILLPVFEMNQFVGA